MPAQNVPSASLPPQPKPEPLFTPAELEVLARIIRDRNQGWIPSLNDCDALIEMVQRYLGGGGQ